MTPLPTEATHALSATARRQGRAPQDLTEARGSVSEAAGAAATTATVSRNGSTSGDLVVDLASDDTSAATVPSTVTILDGQSSVIFDIEAVDDSAADGTQTVTITASTSGYTSGTDTVEVTDDEASVVAIIDDSDGTGFTQTGFSTSTGSKVAAAYNSNNHNMRGGSGEASWTFTGLDDELCVWSGRCGLYIIRGSHCAERGCNHHFV